MVGDMPTRVAMLWKWTPAEHSKCRTTERRFLGLLRRPLSKLQPPCLQAVPAGERSNSLIGTMEYMAPEVINAKGHDRVRTCTLSLPVVYWRCR